MEKRVPGSWCRWGRFSMGHKIVDFIIAQMFYLSIWKPW
jgi:hypothetical protein